MFNTGSQSRPSRRERQRRLRRLPKTLAEDLPATMNENNVSMVDPEHVAQRSAEAEELEARRFGRAAGVSLLQDKYRKLQRRWRAIPFAVKQTDQPDIAQDVNFCYAELVLVKLPPARLYSALSELNHTYRQIEVALQHNWVADARQWLSEAEDSMQQAKKLLERVEASLAVLEQATKRSKLSNRLNDLAWRAEAISTNFEHLNSQWYAIPWKVRESTMVSTGSLLVCLRVFPTVDRSPIGFEGNKRRLDGLLVEVFLSIKLERLGEAEGVMVKATKICEDFETDLINVGKAVEEYQQMIAQTSRPKIELRKKKSIWAAKPKSSGQQAAKVVMPLDKLQSRFQWGVECYLNRDHILPAQQPHPNQTFSLRKHAFKRYLGPTKHIPSNLRQTLSSDRSQPCCICHPVPTDSHLTKNPCRDRENGAACAGESKSKGASETGVKGQRVR